MRIIRWWGCACRFCCGWSSLIARLLRISTIAAWRKICWLTWRLLLHASRYHVLKSGSHIVLPTNDRLTRLQGRHVPSHVTIVGYSQTVARRCTQFMQNAPKIRVFAYRPYCAAPSPNETVRQPGHRAITRTAMAFYPIFELAQIAWDHNDSKDCP